MTTPTLPLQTKRFRIVNEGFVCGCCGRDVGPTSGTTPRNHCPHCLWSRHVDINPGDRANPCAGMMRPIGMLIDTKKTYVILHQCEKCGARSRSRAILKDRNVSDDFDRIVALSEMPIDEGRGEG